MRSPNALAATSFIAASLALAACNPTPSTNDAQANPTASNVASAGALAPVDYVSWREVEAGKLAASLAFMCAGALDDLGRADPTLRHSAALQVPWSIQVARKGKMQAQCVWKGPGERTGRIVIDVLCKDDNNDHCSRFAYGLEGGRRIGAVPHVAQAPPPLSTAYPPGRDETEHARSEALMSWARDHAADKLGALRAEFHGVRVGIEADAKTPVLCGQVREAGKPWHRFVVFSTGTTEFHWLREPRDKAVSEFCDAKGETLQWYAVSDSKMAG